MENTSFGQQEQLVDKQFNAGTVNNYFGSPPVPDRAVVTSSASASRGRLLGTAPSPNRIFTGREAELVELHATLQVDDAPLTSDPVALHGMGGVGKTQTARHYVHLHQSEYAVVCWVSGETLPAYQAQMAALAAELDSSLPISNNQAATFETVKDWMETHGEWLLVVDNAENLSELRPMLPLHKTGRVLLTTRETIPTTFARSIELRYLDNETGATLLLRRAGLLNAHQPLSAIDPTTQADAKGVSADLGGLALAIGAAGAYMQERGISAAKYRGYYAKRHQQLHTNTTSARSDSVTVTFSLALERIEAIPNTGKAAAELVRMCAFLAPDVIPDEVFLTGTEYLEPELARFAADEIDFGDVVATACRWLLVLRESSPPGLWMHRLAQEVVRDSLTAEEQKAIRERVVLTVHSTFPHAKFGTWSLCERLLPHAMLCETFINDASLYTADAARLLYYTGWYLQQRAHYIEAERLTVKALGICREIYQDDHHELAVALRYLAIVYYATGRYDEAVPLLEEAIEIERHTLGEENNEFASSLDNLARVYLSQRRYDDALSLYEQVLDISKRLLGADHLQIATGLGNLANVYSSMGRYEDSIALMQEALVIGYKTLEGRHPEYATCLVVLAGTYIQCGQLEQAEHPLQQALLLRQEIFGAEHPDTANCHYWLGMLRYEQRCPADAAEYFHQALEIQERTLGTEHPDTVNTREWLANVAAM